MGLSVRRDRRGDDQITLIVGDIEGPDAVAELVDMVRLVAQGEQMTLDVSRLTGLDDTERSEFVEAVGSMVKITGL